MKRKHLGELLVEAGSISREQLNHSLKEQKISKEKLGQILVRLGYITEEVLFEFLCNQLGTSGIKLYKEVIDERAVEMIPKSVAEKYKVIPVGFKLEEGTKKLTVAMADSSDLEAVALVESITGYITAPIFAREDQLERIIRYYYPNMESIGFYDELKQGNEDLKILINLIQAVHKSFSLEEIYGVALDSVVKLENVDMVMIYLVDEQRQEAVLQAHRNVPEDYIRRASRIPYPKGITWKVINTGSMLNVENAQKDPDIGPADRDLGHHSVLGIPIILEERAIGVIWFGSYKERKFSKTEVNLLSTLGDQIAIAIAKAKQTKELEERNKNLSLLSMISQSVHQSVDLDQIYRTVLDVTKELKFIDLMAVYLIEGEGDEREAVLKIHWGYPDEHLKMVSRIPYPSGFTWKVIESGESIFYGDASDPSTPLGPAGKALGARILLSIPVKSDNETIGVIHFSSLERTSFTKQELNFLLSLGSQIGIAIAKAKMFRALLHSEGQYRTLVETARDVIFTISTDGTITSLNPAFETLTGWSRAERLGKHFASLVYPDDLPFAMELFQHALQGETPSIFELRIPSKSGEYLTAEFIITLELRDGRVVRGFGIVRDITERKRARERFRLVVESTPNAMVMVNQKGRIILVNSQTEKLFGYSREELIGQSVEILVPERSRNKHSDYRMGFHSYPQARPMGAGRDLFALRKDGSEFPVEIGLNPIQTEEGIVVLSAIVDITERKRAEEKIREQAALIDIATDAILVRDIEHNILFWNKGAERLYGWKAEEAIDKNAISLLHKEDSPQLIEARKSVIEKREWSGELHQVTKDGKELIVQSRWTLVYNEEGKPSSILVINTDITEKKKLEAQFLRAQRMESIGVLAGGIAHDLNNILSPIVIALQLLRQKFTDGQSQNWLNILETSAQRGADLVKQVLSFARGLEGERTSLQVRYLISEIEKIAKGTFPRLIKINTDVPKDLWLICGDPTQLHQVLMNLCVNARDAMPNGGILSISAENLFIDENHARMNIDARVGPYVVITVSDTGVGIPPEIIDRIFEPFFTTKEVGKGTGLGLSTAFGIVKDHGAFIHVRSEIGKGTRFKVYLPAIETTELQKARERQIEELHAGHGELILVVDDEASIRDITRVTLETYGYRVITAENGVEALELYRQNREEIKVVLVDMMMPIMGGPAAIREIRRIDSRVKIIATSGLKENGKLEEVTDAEVDVFLSKPYTAEKLLKTLHEVLSDG